MVFHKLKKYIIVSSVALSVMTVLVLVVLFFSYRQNIVSVRALLTEADESLATGYYYKSEEAARKAYAVSNSEETALMSLKRAYRISEATENPKLIEELSSSAAGRFSSSHRIRSIHAYSLLRSRRAAEAFADMEKKGKSGLETFFLEAALATGRNPDEKTIPDIVKRFPETALLEKEDPETYEHYSSVIHDTRMEVNSALLYAKSGRMDDAFRVVEGEINEIVGQKRDTDTDSSVVEPLFFIAYDANRLDDARNLLKLWSGDETDGILLGADIELLKGNYEQARSLYFAAIDRDATYSAVPYLNSSWTRTRNGEIDAGIGFLEKAHSVFPDSRDVSVELARLYLRLGNPGAARALLGSIKSLTGDTEAELMMLALDTMNLSVSQYRLRLWELFNKNTGNELIATILLSNCLLFEDIENAKKAIRIMEAGGRMDQAGKDFPWLEHFRAIILALEGDTEGALALLRDAYKQTGDRIHGYNIASLLVKTGGYAEAKKILWDILKSRTNVQGNGKYFSAATSLYAEVLLKEGNIKDSKKYAEKALEEDKGNYRARSVLSEIRKRTLGE